jgi:hypothetical protein
MYLAEIGMILVAVPATIEAGVRVSVVYSIIFSLSSKPPLYFEYGRIRTSRRLDSGGSDSCPNELFRDTVWLKADSRDLGMPIQYVTKPGIDGGIDRSWQRHR